MKPAILTDITEDMDMYDEETFGPSTTVRIVENEQQAIDIVNESSYGLDAFLFTKSMSKAVEIAGRLQVGRVRVNAAGHERECPCQVPTA